MLRRLTLAVALGAAAALALACSSGGDDSPADTPSPAAEGDDLTRTAEAGGITVDATWLTEASVGDVDADLSAYPIDQFVLVEIGFTTHSGNLNEIEMEEASDLKQGDGDAAPVAWLSLSDDSHHRAGVLAFERTEGDGPAELTVDVGDEKVSLLWEAAPP